MKQQYYRLDINKIVKYREEFQYLIKSIIQNKQLRTIKKDSREKSYLILRLIKNNDGNMKNLENYEILIPTQEILWRKLNYSNVKEIFYFENYTYSF